MKSRDYEEFVVSLNENDARYLIVGAHAVAFHARARATKDFDLFIEPPLTTMPSRTKDSNGSLGKIIVPLG
jgi:predicted nucleotidyltransferase